MAMSVFETLIPESILEEASSSVGRRLLVEYGSVFLANGGATAPDRLIFRDQADVERFQNSVSISSARFGDITIELQTEASESLQNAISVAAKQALSITPRSADSGRRSYDDTVSLWHSRVEPALQHWVENKKLSVDQADRIRSLSPFEQVPVVLELEGVGVFFAKDLSKTILYSVAPPGTSQHLSMLAFDVTEFNDPKIREILEDNCWYQTVPSDLPHFTYLGIPKERLHELGLKLVISSERDFWVPNM